MSFDQRVEYKLSNIIINEYPSLICVGDRLLGVIENSYIILDDILKTRLANLVEEVNVNSSYTNKVIDHLKNKLRCDEDELFSFEEWVVPFKNGYYDVKSGNFREIHDKKFFYQIPHKFKGKSYDCPIFKKALEDWLCSYNNKCEPNDILEIMGYLMTMNNNLKKAFFVYGIRNAGKSQFGRILDEIIGDKNMCNISLERMNSDKHGTDGMQLKIINKVGDHGGAEIKDYGIFKELVGGDKKIAYEKKFKDKSEFHNVCKQFLIGNRLPKIKIPSDTFYEKWILIGFLNKGFKTTRIPFYEKIINNEAEMRGIISQCIVGLERLYKRGFFREKICKNPQHFWKYNSNSLYRFISDKCIIEKGLMDIKCSEFNEEYWDYLETLTKKAEIVGLYTPNSITTELRKFGIYRTKKGNFTYFKNVRFKTTAELIIHSNKLKDMKEEKHYDNETKKKDIVIKTVDVHEKQIEKHEEELEKIKLENNNIIKEAKKKLRKNG